MEQWSETDTVRTLRCSGKEYPRGRRETERGDMRPGKVITEETFPVGIFQHLQPLFEDVIVRTLRLPVNPIEKPELQREFP